MISDLSEREEALDPSRSFIVEAPAGSGKTGLLVQRYLRLLSTVERPEHVVAMTFTRKAAAEMKQRIHDALLAAKERRPATNDFDERLHALASAVLDEDRRHSWNLLEDLSRLQIQTIDSLCASITRRTPVSSRFGGLANVVENADDLYRIAAGHTLSDLAEGAEAARSLLMRLGRHFDNDFNSLQGQIVSMLKQRDQWRFADCTPGDTTADYCALLDHAAGALERVFQAHGTVDFTAITLAAIRVLGLPEQPSDLLYSLDHRIQHLLVDEFQDTSVAQYQLINALTAQWSEGDGHTLFLVGDPMQSIYGFRGAEVSLFLESWHKQQLESVRLHPVALKTNFRTTPEILGWVESKFNPLMLQDAASGVRFRISQAARDAGGKPPELTPFIGDKGDREANAVVSLAEQALGRGSVAILVRNRSHLEQILPILRRERVRYEAIEIDSLAEQQHVLDLISLTRAVLHLGDRVSWLACLRAPWCGLTLADLSAIAENERTRTILDLISDPSKIASLSPDGRWRAIRAQEILSAAVNQAGRIPIRELIEQTWLSLGGPAVLQNIYQREDVETFLELLESLEDGGTIRDFNLLSERLGCLFAKPETGQNYVQVMTVHQAKGLEFDTVIIPHMEGQSRPRDRDLLVSNETVDESGNSTLSVAAKPRRGEESTEYDRIYEQQQQKELFEVDRLLYVACTRARNELYLFGNVKTKKDGVELARPSHTSFLGRIWPTTENEFRSAARRSPLQRALFAVAENPPAKTVLRRLPLKWQLPALAAGVEWQPELHQATASARKVTYEWVSDTGRRVGTVVHDLLRRAIETGDADSFAANLGSLRPVVRSELLRLGVSRANEPEATDRVMRAVRNTLDSDRGRWILAPHFDSRTEWPIGGRLGNTLVNGTVDRSFRDEEGRLWIIDYKTSEHQGGLLQDFLDEEQRRYRTQLENYAALLSEMSSGPVWLGLYFPLLDAWREWEYETRSVLAAQYTGE